MLMAARVEHPACVYSSSTSVYGNPRYLPTTRRRDPTCSAHTPCQNSPVRIMQSVL